MGSQSGTRGRPSIIGMDKGIGPREAQIMRVIAGMTQPMSVRDVCDRLSGKGRFSYQSVLNCMRRLVGKGILERTMRAGRFLHTSRTDPERLVAEMALHVTQQLGCDVDRVICRLLRIDPEVGVKAIARSRRRAGRAGPSAS